MISLETASQLLDLDPRALGTEAKPGRLHLSHGNDGSLLLCLGTRSGKATK